MRPKPVILDVDAGIDDALAILLALRSDELDVRAITTVAGNVRVGQCTKNVLRVLSILDGPSPCIVARGEGAPLAKRPSSATSVHGRDGLGDLGDEYYPSLDWGLVETESAVELLPRLIAARPGEVTVIATGPATNLAKAMKEDPSSMAKARQVVVMAGAFREAGNVPPHGLAEFNAYADPDALQVVLGFDVPVIVVPLDVTHRVRLGRAAALGELGSAPSKVAQFVLDVTERYMAYHRDSEGFHGAYLHDPLAVAIAMDPSLAKLVPARVVVDVSGGPTRGMTKDAAEGFEDSEFANCAVAMSLASPETSGEVLRVLLERMVSEARTGDT